MSGNFTRSQHRNRQIFLRLQIAFISQNSKAMETGWEQEPLLHTNEHFDSLKRHAPLYAHSNCQIWRRGQLTALLGKNQLIFPPILALRIAWRFKATGIG